MQSIQKSTVVLNVLSIIVHILYHRPSAIVNRAAALKNSGSVRKTTGRLSRQTKSAHAEVILPSVSVFLTVVKFFAFDLLGRGGEGPNVSLLIVQFLSSFFAEFFAGHEFCHGFHVLSSMAVE